MKKRFSVLSNLRKLTMPGTGEIPTSYTETFFDRTNTQLSQVQLLAHYRSVAGNRNRLPKLQDVGFRVFSQNDEDGIILYIFSLIGFTNKVCIDIGFCMPYGSNVTNLLCNLGFTGLLIEGGNIEQTQHFFSLHPDTSIYPPKVVHSWVTRENINKTILTNGFKGDIDLLSIDIDGVDYWIWKEVNIVRPRVVVMEYLNLFGPRESYTVPYDPKFKRSESHPDFFGATLLALVRLNHLKGYRLIGCNKYSFNAFFLRNDIANKLLPEVSCADCLNNLFAIEANKTRLPAVRKLNWQKV